MASVLALHLLAGLTLFHMRFPVGWMLPPMLVAVLLSAAMGLRAEARKRCVLVLDAEGGVTVRTAAGEYAARAEPGAVDFGWAIWLRLRAGDGGDEHPPPPLANLMLLPAHVADGHWRLFRIWLKHRALRADAAGA